MVRKAPKGNDGSARVDARSGAALVKTASPAPSRKKKSSEVARKAAKVPTKRATKHPAKPGGKTAGKALAKSARRVARKGVAISEKKRPSKQQRQRQRQQQQQRKQQSLPSPQRDVQVKTLDPLVVCGPHTSVKHLFRVRERIDGVRTNHLVFFDKHGWYCEHGRGCHAVTIVRQANPSISD